MERMCKLHTERSGLELNPPSFCCEATVPGTAPLCCPVLGYDLKKTAKKIQEDKLLLEPSYHNRTFQKTNTIY